VFIDDCRMKRIRSDEFPFKLLSRTKCDHSGWFFADWVKKTRLQIGRRKLRCDFREVATRRMTLGASSGAIKERFTGLRITCQQQFQVGIRMSVAGAIGFL